MYAMLFNVFGANKSSAAFIILKSPKSAGSLCQIRGVKCSFVTELVMMVVVCGGSRAADEDRRLGLDASNRCAVRLLGVQHRRARVIVMGVTSPMCRDGETVKSL